MKQMAPIFRFIPVVLCLALAAGCGEISASKNAANEKAALSEETTSISNSVSPSESATHFPEKTAMINGPAGRGAMTPLELSLARWREGDKTAAVHGFLEIDWKKNAVPFVPGAPLSLREKDLSTPSAAERERLLGQAMLQLKDLKQLAAAVLEKGTNAAATDQELAKRCFAKLGDCGAALDQPDALEIVQLTGRAIRKLGGAQSAQRDKRPKSP